MEQTKKLTYRMTALVFIATFAIRIPIPLPTAYVHLGDCMISLRPCYWVEDGFAAGVGSMLGDLLVGYPMALPTL